MALEIEKRYLLAALPASSGNDVWHSMRQGYLAIEVANEVRVREVDGQCWLTVKSGSGVVRDEVEVLISQAQFEQLWPLTAGRQLEKRRLCLPWASGTLCIDEYVSPLNFLLAEVEFASQAAADSFVPPDFFGPEVTDIASMSTFPLLIERLKRWKATGK